MLHRWAGPHKYGHKCRKWVKSKHLRAETRHRGLPRQQAERGLSQPSSKAAQGQLLNDPNKVRKRGSCVSGNNNNNNNNNSYRFRVRTRCASRAHVADCTCHVVQWCCWCCDTVARGSKAPPARPKGQNTILYILYHSSAVAASDKLPHIMPFLNQ